LLCGGVGYLDLDGIHFSVCVLVGRASTGFRLIFLGSLFAPVLFYADLKFCKDVVLFFITYRAARLIFSSAFD
jgi:hypothetical protein